MHEWWCREGTLGDCHPNDHSNQHCIFKKAFGISLSNWNLFSLRLPSPLFIRHPSWPPYHGLSHLFEASKPSLSLPTFFFHVITLAIIFKLLLKIQIFLINSIFTIYGTDWYEIHNNLANMADFFFFRNLIGNENFGSMSFQENHFKKCDPTLSILRSSFNLFLVTHWSLYFLPFLILLFFW